MKRPVPYFRLAMEVRRQARLQRSFRVLDTHCMPAANFLEALNKVAPQARRLLAGV